MVLVVMLELDMMYACNKVCTAVSVSSNGINIKRRRRTEPTTLTETTGSRLTVCEANCIQLKGNVANENS